MFEHKEELAHAVMPAINLSTSWTKKSTVHPGRTNNSYSRTKCPNFDELSQSIQTIYKTLETVLCCSGMSAIACVLNHYNNLNTRIHIIADKELYCDTTKLIKNLGKVHDNYNVKIIDMTKPEELKKTLDHISMETRPLIGKKGGLSSKSKHYSNQQIVIFTESCSNPSGRFINIENIKSVAIGNNIDIVVDNSWLSGTYNPLNYGADILVESLSKHMGGGDVIMGMITGRKKDRMEMIANHVYSQGIRVSPFDAYNATKSIMTLMLRLEKVGRTTELIAEFLETIPCVRKVMYPMLKSHPTYMEAKKYLTVGPGIVRFLLPGNKFETIKFLDSSKKILYATSYGKPETLLDPYPQEEKSDDGVNTWVRLAIGYVNTFEEVRDELLSMLLQKYAKNLGSVNKYSDTDKEVYVLFDNGKFIKYVDYEKDESMKGTVKDTVKDTVKGTVKGTVYQFV